MFKVQKNTDLIEQKKTFDDNVKLKGVAHSICQAKQSTPYLDN